ncbi:hypothetical protein BTZ20_1661 [Rhodococcus sp. MTM3W5.2]|uniref:DUF4386 domain-containing protein n=1 Tax=Rhodococcus sp. MTM3W5.2 TaxID=1805827 RepID=UPI00097959BD|nr:DUF4386 domain-containing protein [Rhodococcus sp. MTM3W5.2]AQA24717.1 hypothetical protein BTZ20_1661 [Rhodococcus sp. MTM3W5.2]
MTSVRAALPHEGVAAAQDQSWRRACLVAGVGLLLMAALAAFAIPVAVDGLVTPGDATQTARDLTDSAGAFRLGIVSLVLVAALDVVVAWALYAVLLPADRAISMLAAMFRLGYAGVFLVAVAQLVGVLRLLDADSAAALGADQRDAQVLLGVEAFHDIWDIGLFFFGLHLLAFGTLAFRSGFVPRSLAVLVAVAGFGYAFDSVAAVLSGGSLQKIGAFTFIGELLLAIWLVAGPGRRQRQGLTR